MEDLICTTKENANKTKNTFVCAPLKSSGSLRSTIKIHNALHKARVWRQKAKLGKSYDRIIQDFVITYWLWVGNHLVFNCIKREYYKICLRMTADFRI